MAPKIKITKENIIAAAVEAVRAEGIDALNARALAAKLGCSTQPIFSNFSTMDEVELAVINEANELCEEYISREVASGEYPPYKASGMAYIRFARDEKELFKLLFMRDRTGEPDYDEKEELRPILKIIQDSLGLSEEEAFLFHLRTWIFVHGIAVMAATSYVKFDSEFISKALTDAYMGFKHQLEREE